MIIRNGHWQSDFISAPRRGLRLICFSTGRALLLGMVV